MMLAKFRLLPKSPCKKSTAGFLVVVVVEEEEEE
jgi:hypothetical protein